MSPCFSPLPWHSLLSVRPCTGAACTLIVVSLVVLDEGLLHPRMALEAGSGVALRYEDKTAQLGSGATWQWCPVWWGGQDGPWQWGQEHH